MRKTVLIVLVMLMVTSCKKKISANDISKINGYWEIEKVILANGEKKDYKINSTIDYFELHHPETSGQFDNKMVGFRQKVMPQMNGTYTTNNLKETISISNEEGNYFINYTTSFGTWKEEILELQDSILVLLNKDKLEYHYKKQIPFSLK